MTTLSRASIALGLAAAITALALCTRPAQAHDWYPRSCCSDQDCAPAAPGAVTASPGGWTIATSGEVIPYNDPRIRPTPPQGGADFHVCHVAGDPTARAICLFVPNFGS